MKGTESYRDYVAWEQLPHIWCAGCGHGIIMRSLTVALAEMELSPDRVLLATGIGCSGRTGDYVTCHRFQGTHGRTLAFATGIKLARPDLKVICLMGDGDCSAIGGNHLLHAARRNIDVTAIVANNFNYGMTGGQYSPLTPLGSNTSTSREGFLEDSLDIPAVAAAAGAGYVARSTVFHGREIIRFLKEAINKEGFSLVEVLEPCPTYYGRYNSLGREPDMFSWLKEHTIPLERYKTMPEEDRQGLYWRGKLVDRPVTGLVARMRGGDSRG